MVAPRSLHRRRGCRIGDAFEAGAFGPLLEHNVADVLRTKALASLAERYCGKSEFQLKSLTPSVRDPDLSPPR